MLAPLIPRAFIPDTALPISLTLKARYTPLYPALVKARLCITGLKLWDTGSPSTAKRDVSEFSIILQLSENAHLKVVRCRESEN